MRTIAVLASILMAALMSFAPDQLGAADEGAAATPAQKTFSSVKCDTEGPARLAPYRGTVGLFGNAPHTAVSFITENGAATYQLTGPLEPELKSLGGAKLRIMAMPARNAEGDSNASLTPAMALLTVYSYEIIDVGGGQKPYVGVVEKLENGTLALLVNDWPEPVELSVSGQVQQRFAANVGKKVWIVGKRDAVGKLKVMRHQFIESISEFKLP